MKIGKFEGPDYVVFVICLVLNCAVIGVTTGTLIGTILGTLVSVLFIKPHIRKS